MSVRTKDRLLPSYCLPSDTCMTPGGGGGGGGGTQIFSIYVSSDPASTVHPKKKSGISRTPKIFEILATQKNIPSLFLDLKKTLKCIEMTLKLAQFCNDPKKYPQNLHTPKTYSFFSKPKKILKFRILNPKNSPSLRRPMCENIRVPPPPPWVYDKRWSQGTDFLSHPNTNIMAFFLAHSEIRQKEKKAHEYAGILHNDVTLTCGWRHMSKTLDALWK